MQHSFRRRAGASIPPFVHPFTSRLMHVLMHVSQENMVGVIVDKAVELQHIGVLGPSLAQSLHTDDDPTDHREGERRYVLLLYPGTSPPSIHPSIHPRVRVSSEVMLPATNVQRLLKHTLQTQ